jgi:hypothetical protein
LFIGSVVLTGGGAIVVISTPNGHRWRGYGGAALSVLGVLLLVLALISAANSVS